ncbi:hypothetical protein PPGU19_045010 [Paraburkholderia sp. PGU19]|nr:hypothetical protein PPGU19_045010 [Paraburkholderia sp. PGU19]
MQDPEALGGLSHQGGVDYRGEENDGAFIAPENLNVASATQHVLKSGGTFIVNDPSATSQVTTTACSSTTPACCRSCV